MSELTDAEICKELEPYDITHVRRFISRKTGQEVKLNTFLITFYTPNIQTYIRIGLYNVRVSPYVTSPVRKSPQPEVTDKLLLQLMSRLSVKHLIAILNQVEAVKIDLLTKMKPLGAKC